MYAVNIKKPEKVFLFGHTITKFLAYFNRAISGGKKGSSVDNQKMDKLGQGQSTNIWIPSHDNVFPSY